MQFLAFATLLGTTEQYSGGERAASVAAQGVVKKKGDHAAAATACYGCCCCCCSHAARSELTWQMQMDALDPACSTASLGYARILIPDAIAEPVILWQPLGPACQRLSGSIATASLPRAEQASTVFCCRRLPRCLGEAGVRRTSCPERSAI